jgi:hypothetical protein
VDQFDADVVAHIETREPARWWKADSRLRSIMAWRAIVERVARSPFECGLMRDFSAEEGPGDAGEIGAELWNGLVFIGDFIANQLVAVEL